MQAAVNSASERLIDQPRRATRLWPSKAAETIST